MCAVVHVVVHDIEQLSDIADFKRYLSCDVPVRLSQ